MNKIITYFITILGLLVLGSFGLASCQAAAAQNNYAKAAKIEAIGHAILNAFSGVGIAVLSTVPIIAIVAIVAGMVILGIFAIKFRSQFAPPTVQVHVVKERSVLFLPAGTSKRELYDTFGEEIVGLIDNRSTIMQKRGRK